MISPSVRTSVGFKQQINLEGNLLTGKFIFILYISTQYEVTDYKKRIPFTMLMSRIMRKTAIMEKNYLLLCRRKKSFKMDETEKTTFEKNDCCTSSSRNSPVSLLTSSMSNSNDSSSISLLSFETTLEEQNQSDPLEEQVLNTEELVDEMNKCIMDVSDVLNVSVDEKPNF